MNKTTNFNGIKGLRGREPVGAVISIGRKTHPDDLTNGRRGRVGVPIEKNRWHILTVRGTPVEAGGRTHDIRVHNPRFRTFNELPVERRSTLAVELVHAELDDGFNARLSKPRGPSSRYTPPSGRPFCEGDGNQASRYTGENQGTEEFRTMRCPNELCEFRQGTSPSCKPLVTLLGRLLWPESVRDRLPSVLVKYVTRSWNTAANLGGLFESVTREAENMGIPRFSWAFLPIQLQVSEHTGKGRRYPVVHASLLTTPYDFLINQMERREALDGFQPLALTDLQDPAERARDVHSVDGGRSGIAPSFAGERVGPEPAEGAPGAAAGPQGAPAPAPAEQLGWGEALDGDR